MSPLRRAGRWCSRSPWPAAEGPAGGNCRGARLLARAFLLCLLLITCRSWLTRCVTRCTRSSSRSVAYAYGPQTGGWPRRRRWTKCARTRWPTWRPEPAALPAAFGHRVRARSRDRNFGRERKTRVGRGDRQPHFAGRPHRQAMPRMRPSRPVAASPAGSTAAATRCPERSGARRSMRLVIALPWLTRAARRDAGAAGADGGATGAPVVRRREQRIVARALAQRQRRGPGLPRSDRRGALPARVPPTCPTRASCPVARARRRRQCAPVEASVKRAEARPGDAARGADVATVKRVAPFPARWRWRQIWRWNAVRADGSANAPGARAGPGMAGRRPRRTASSWNSASSTPTTRLIKPGRRCVSLTAG